MKPGTQGSNIPRALFVAGLAFVLYYVAVVLPQGASYRHKLQSLRPTEVPMVRLHMEDRVGSELVRRERILREEQVPRFLILLSQAKSAASNHRERGWTCFVDIDTTTDIAHFSFAVRSTQHHGVQFDLMSGGRSGWDYGTLRNDELGPFIESIFRAPQ